MIRSSFHKSPSTRSPRGEHGTCPSPPSRGMDESVPDSGLKRQISLCSLRRPQPRRVRPATTSRRPLRWDRVASSGATLRAAGFHFNTPRECGTAGIFLDAEKTARSPCISEPGAPYPDRFAVDDPAHRESLRVFPPSHGECHDNTRASRGPSTRGPGLASPARPGLRT